MSLYLTRFCWQCKVRDQSTELKELLKLKGKANDEVLGESVLEVPPAPSNLESDSMDGTFWRGGDRNKGLKGKEKNEVLGESVPAPDLLQINPRIQSRICLASKVNYSRERRMSWSWGGACCRCPRPF